MIADLINVSGNEPKMKNFNLIYLSANLIQSIHLVNKKKIFLMKFHNWNSVFFSFYHIFLYIQPVLVIVIW